MDEMPSFIGRLTTGSGEENVDGSKHLSRPWCLLNKMGKMNIWGKQTRVFMLDRLGGT